MLYSRTRTSLSHGIKMTIHLTDIEDDDEIAPEPSRGRIGCIIMEDDNSWTAACPGLSHSSQGLGPFDGLPTNAIWLVNRDYKTVQALQNANKDVRLKLSGWMRVALEDMPGEWGIDSWSNTDNTLANAGTVASIFDRVLKIALETACKSGMSTYSRDSDLYAAIERGPSLATGLRNLCNKQMDASIPSDIKVGKKISEALSYGVSRVQETEVKKGEFIIYCQAPRLSHALRVTARGAPGPGKWQKASLSEEKPLDNKAIAELHSLERPVMIVANVKERSGPGHDYLGAWVRPNNKAIQKIAYTLEEVTTLLPWFQFEDYSVLVGPAWRKPITGKLIEALMEVCGGRDIAASCWSANVVAENILCGGFRKLSGAESLSPECVWLTVHDRLEMVRPIETLMQCGATLVSTYAGSLIIKIPEDPEMIALAANAIWESGLHLNIGTVQRMKSMNIELPHDPDAWGGAPEDLILGQCLQKIRRTAIWHFDSILEHHPQDRNAAFAAILG